MDNGAELERVESFVELGNYHAAMNIAISALNACRRSHDQPGVDRFLAVIQGIAATMVEAFGSEGEGPG